MLVDCPGVAVGVEELGGAKEGGDLQPAADPQRGLRAGLGPRRHYSGFSQWDQLPLGV